jgi:rhodanese-related sulfurtransferase
MPTLRERLGAASTDLDAVAGALSLATSTVPSTTRTFFQLFAGWALELREAAKLLDVRDSALRQISLLSDSARHCPRESANSLWNGESIPYWHARLMAFQSYMACSWAAYDTLAKVSGRLCLNESQAKNLSAPMNLAHLLQKPKEPTKAEGIGFWYASQLKQTYGWPISFSYASRNWIMHEGQFQNGNLFFEGSDRLATLHRLTEGALKEIKDRCVSYEVSDTDTLSGALSADPRPDFLAYLLMCNQEVDECAGILASWACAAAKHQAQLLLVRHSTIP